MYVGKGMAYFLRVKFISSCLRLTFFVLVAYSWISKQTEFWFALGIFDIFESYEHS